MEEADEEVKKVESEKRSRYTEFDDKENEPSDKKTKKDIKVEVEKDIGATKVVQTSTRRILRMLMTQRKRNR